MHAIQSEQCVQSFIFSATDYTLIKRCNKKYNIKSNESFICYQATISIISLFIMLIVYLHFVGAGVAVTSLPGAVLPDASSSAEPNTNISIYCQ
jgi:hypothetical protein